MNMSVSGSIKKLKIIACTKNARKKGNFFFFFCRILWAFYEHATIFNFLMEPDTNIFIQNKNVPYGRLSSNTVKKLYWVSENSELRVHFKCMWVCVSVCPDDSSVTV